MVAKSYQNLSTIGNPYTKNGKEYIKVVLKSGAQKEVRWYSEKEYARLYPTVSQWRPLKETLGFINDFIYIFQGEDKPFPAARYTKLWGWYLPSNEVPPIPARKLYWNMVADGDKLKSESEIAAFLSLYNSPKKGEPNGDSLDKYN